MVADAFSQKVHGAGELIWGRVLQALALQWCRFGGLRKTLPGLVL